MHRWLEHTFGAGSVATLKHLSSVTHTFVVRWSGPRGGGAVFRASQRSKKALEQEREMMRALAKRGVPIAEMLPVSDRDDYAVALRLGGKEYTLTRVAYIDGEPCHQPGHAAASEPLTPTRAQAHGRALGLLHRATDEASAEAATGTSPFPGYGERPLDADGFHELLEELARNGQYFPRFAEMKEKCERLTERLKILERRSQGVGSKFGFCHLDCHTGNAMFGANGQVTLIDFDDFGRTYRAFDFNIARACCDWFGPEQAAVLWRAFKEGYREGNGRDITAAEEALFPLFQALRKLRFMHELVKTNPQVFANLSRPDFADREKLMGIHQRLVDDFLACVDEHQHRH